MAANRMPAADVDISADLVRRLLVSQHPDLGRLPVEFLANGWDNALFRLGTELVIRMPRRQLGATIIEHEQRWLPSLAPRLPLPIPYPERTGHSALGYPYSWSVVPYIPGTPAADEEPGDLDSAAVAAAVGGFLGALHVPAPPDAPANPFRGVPLAARAPNFAANLGLLDGAVDRDLALRSWESALAAPGYDGPPRWLHGDLHPANILVLDGQVSGVIDFGDITSGDPATDLAVAWMLLPPAWHGAFRAAYEAAGGLAGDALWQRARGWALNFALVFLAHSADNPQLRSRRPPHPPRRPGLVSAPAARLPVLRPQPAGSTVQNRVSPDDFDHPSACGCPRSGGCREHRTAERARGDNADANEKVTVLQLILIALDTGAHVDHANTRGWRELGHAQMHDEPGRIPAELCVICREPVGEGIAAAQSEVRGDRNIGRVQHGEEAAERVTAGAEQRFNQAGNPRPRENVELPGPPVLGSFPGEQGAESADVV